MDNSALARAWDEWSQRSRRRAELCRNGDLALSCDSALRVGARIISRAHGGGNAIHSPVAKIYRAQEPCSFVCVAVMHVHRARARQLRSRFPKWPAILQVPFRDPSRPHPSFAQSSGHTLEHRATRQSVALLDRATSRREVNNCCSVDRKGFRGGSRRAPLRAVRTRIRSEAVASA
jgi:hypothetical protein